MEQLKKAVDRISPLSDADFDLIRPSIKYIKVKKHDLLMPLGGVYRHFYFLSKGLFRMYYINPEGQEVNSRFSGPNQFVGDYQSMLTEKPCRYCTQALEDSELVTLKIPDILGAYQKSHAWEKFGRLLAEQSYLELKDRIESLLFLTPEERYVELLDSRPELFHLVPQFHIASYLGVKPESLSRLKKRLQKNGRFPSY